MIDLNIALAAVILLLIVGFYFSAFRSSRDGAEVLSRDKQLLRSDNLGLGGRPDRIERLKNGAIIPLEMKSGRKRKLYDSHLVQIGVYLLLVEDVYGQRPPYGIVAFGDGSEIKVKNTKRLNNWTLAQADQLRRQRANLAESGKVRFNPRKCKGCSVRYKCSQSAY